MLKDLLKNCSSYSLIIANGEFPKQAAIIALINKADHIICCDGATNNILKHRFTPSYIIGDCDSLDKTIYTQFKNIIVQISEQNSNDLTKAVRFAKSLNIHNIFILGATGLREDHTIANISLLAEYKKDFQQVAIISDYGIFTAHQNDATIKTQPKQQISFFAIYPNTIINCKELKWVLDNYRPHFWFSATLNEANSDHITIYSNNLIIVFRAFELKCYP